MNLLTIMLSLLQLLTTVSSANVCPDGYSPYEHYETQAPITCYMVENHGNSCPEGYQCQLPKTPYTDYLGFCCSKNSENSPIKCPKLIRPTLEPGVCDHIINRYDSYTNCTLGFDCILELNTDPAKKTDQLPSRPSCKWIYAKNQKTGDVQYLEICERVTGCPRIEHLPPPPSKCHHRYFIDKYGCEAAELLCAPGVEAKEAKLLVERNFSTEHIFAETSEETGERDFFEPEVSDSHVLFTVNTLNIPDIDFTSDSTSPETSPALKITPESGSISASESGEESTPESEMVKDSSKDAINFKDLKVERNASREQLHHYLEQIGAEESESQEEQSTLVVNLYNMEFPVNEAVQFPPEKIRIQSPASSGESGSAEMDNRHIYCCLWARNGECLKNPLYMKLDCQKSCGTSTCSEPNSENCAVNLQISECQHLFAVWDSRENGNSMEEDVVYNWAQPIQVQADEEIYRKVYKSDHIRYPKIRLADEKVYHKIYSSNGMRYLQSRLANQNV